MQMTGNTILITGGGSGIGRALAEAFHKRGNQVIISGRRRDALEETLVANPGMAALTLDITRTEAIKTFATQLTSAFPALNVVIQNAGIMRNEALLKGETETAEETIATNLLGPIRLTAALLSHLTAQQNGALMTVSSGLAYLPLSMTPTYAATKAAIHSYTQSLRYQVKDTPLQVLELVPPYVQTGLMGERQANDPNAMPLKDFIDEVLTILETQPDATEILVERVKPLRFAEGGADKAEAYAAFYKKFNDGMVAARQGEL
ncbi:DltE [Robbsia andropogonis]|uniref:DltE n=1 Tax=Robbsia andropogonis TaxID=28092 RepID=A0A0F5JX25_9BURK|nr:SDR family oxidoreductase [Robbsia andropogonis]KKB62179.1 DltE [Robbsia andropogonis]MCP1119448.1 SDR family oxidoreductase [Robbsia andropogonis]MCP1129431.1 SDR family oxidoreductase [Robbsia andropogonis]